MLYLKMKLETIKAVYRRLRNCYSSLIVIIFNSFCCLFENKWFIFTKRYYLNSMKKFVLVLVAVAFIGGSFTSCKSHEKCPAYNKVDTNSKKSI